MSSAKREARSSAKPVAVHVERARPITIATWMGAIGLFVLPLFFDFGGFIPSIRGPFFVPGSLVYKALIVQAIVAMAFVLVAFAIARGQTRLRWHSALWVALGFAAWVIVSTAFSFSPGNSLLGSFGQAEGTLALLAMVAWLFVVLQLVDGMKPARTLSAAIVWAGVAEAAYGIVQWLGADPMDWQGVAGSAGRALGTLGNPDMYGAMLVMALLLCLGFAFTETRRYWSLAYWLGTGLIACGLLVSLTRAAWLGAVVGVIVFAVLGWRWIRRPSAGQWMAIAGVVVALMVVAGVSSGSSGRSGVAERVTSVTSGTDRNVNVRFEFLRIASTATAKRPLTGYGPDLFDAAYYSGNTLGFERVAGPKYRPDNAHDSVMQLAATLGVPGALLWLGLLGVAAWAAVGRIRTPEGLPRTAGIALVGVTSAAAGYFVATLFTPAVPTNTFMFVTLLGLMIAPSARRLDLEASKLARVLAWLAVALAGAGAVWALTLLSADAFAGMASNRDLPAYNRVTWAETAIRLDPFYPAYRQIAAKAYADLATAQGAGDAGVDSGRVKENLDTSLSWADSALKLYPRDLQGLVLKTTLLRMTAEETTPNPAALAAAAKLGRQTVESAPEVLQVRYWYARTLQAQGKFAAAADQLREALKEYPAYTDATLLLVEVEVSQGRSDLARAAIDAARKATTIQTDRDRLDYAASRIP